MVSIKKPRECSRPLKAIIPSAILAFLTLFHVAYVSKVFGIANHRKEYSIDMPTAEVDGKHNSAVPVRDAKVNNDVNDKHPIPIIDLNEVVKPISFTSALSQTALANEIGNPTLDRPFIFFHIPKCGGSTLRNAFNKATKSIGKSLFAPCYGSVPCPTTELDLFGKDPEIERKAACAEVFAGHFTTRLIPILLSNSRNTRDSGNHCTRERDLTLADSQVTPIDCLIAVREPVSRFVSHYYHFIEKNNPVYHGRKLKDMSLDELTVIIHDSANNTMLDYLSKHLLDTSNHDPAPDTSITLEEKVSAANAVLKQCVIIVMEDWETSSTLAESVVPWLKGYLTTQPALNKASGSRHESIEDFAPDIATALQEILKGDTAVYNYALDVHQEQLRTFGIGPKGKANEEERNEIVVGEVEDDSPSEPIIPGLTNVPFVKAVTYYGRGNPLNFWDQRFEDFIDSDFKSFRDKNFNTVIFLVPWAGIQLTIVPSTYKSFILERIEFVLRKAVEHGLRTIFRMSYPHSFDPMNDHSGNDRCRLIMGVDTSNGIKNGWLDYMSKMSDIFTKDEYKESYLYSFTSWEDFFCLISFSQNNADREQERLRLSKEIGFDKYVKEQYTPDEIRDMFDDEKVEPGEYPIPRWDVKAKSFTAYIKFIDFKWWEIVELGRSVHPHLSMELRVDIEGGKVPYDMHLNDMGPPKQIYWGGYMGSKPGVALKADTAIVNLEKVMAHATVNAQSPVILGQFNFQDNTPHLVMRNVILEECNDFLEKSVAVLKKYTKGYGLWAYRNYRQSEIFNGSFLLGLEGWSSTKIGQGSIGMDADGFLQLSSFSDNSSVKIEQGMKQHPKEACDDGNTDMELCFKYRMKGQGEGELHVVWDGSKVDNGFVEFSGQWKEKCLHVPTLTPHQWYLIGFEVQGRKSVNIDNVEFFCHTHMMYMNDVHNKPISTCGDGISKLNEFLG